MELIRIDGTEYIVGINWSSAVLQGNINKKFNELIAGGGANGEPAKYAFVVKNKDNAVLGIYDGLKKPKEKVAAVHLANANAVEYASVIQREAGKNLLWVSVQKVQGDRYWVGAALNGLPFQTDMVVEQFDIYTAVTNFISGAGVIYQDNLSTVVYYDDESLLLSDLKNATVYNNDFSTLVSGAKYKVAIKQKTSKGAILGTVVGLAALVGIIYGGYVWYEEQEAEEEAGRMAQERNASDAELIKRQNEYEKAKEEALKKAKEDAINAMNARLTNPSMASVLKSWNETLGESDLVIQGWYKREINCGLVNTKTKTFCDYTIERNKVGNVGTVKDIKDYYADRALSDLTVDDSGDVAVAKRVNENEFEVEKGDFNTLNDFDFEAFKYKNMSELQLLALNGLEKTVSKPLLITTKVVLPKPPQGIKQNLNFEDLNLGIAEGSVSIKGKELYKLQGLMDKLKSLEKPFYLKSITIKGADNTSSYQWEIKGSFFVEDKDHKGGNLDKIQIPKSEIIKKQK